MRQILPSILPLSVSKNLTTDTSVLSGLKTHLMQPDLVKEFVAEYHREAEPGDGRVRGGP
jgi:hypothetical protein